MDFEALRPLLLMRITDQPTGVSLSLGEIEAIVGRLPPDARDTGAFWTGARRYGSPRNPWQTPVDGGGFELSGWTATPDLCNGTVSFARL